jgi:hypothetical protein
MPKMTKKNIQYYSLAGLGTMTVLRAQGRCGFDGNAGSRASQGRRCHELREDDGTTGLGTARVDGVTGSGTAPGAQRHVIGEDNVVVGSGMVSRAWGRHLRDRRHHRLRLGKMVAHKGARLMSGTTARRLRGGLDDGVEALGRTQ